MILTTRVSDELGAEIDRVAAANGQTRSAWIALVLTRAALAPENDELPTSTAQGRGHPDDQVRITVRLNRTEVEAIEAAGAHAGLSRNEWIKRTIRWQLWDKAARLRLAPTTAVELGKLRKEVLRIGRNVNQAVHAMNAANQPGSTLDLARIAEPFIETCSDLKASLASMRETLEDKVGGEVGYWVGAYVEVRP